MLKKDNMPERVEIVLKNGVAVPCNGCKKRAKCFLFRRAIKKNKYNRPSNRLGYCDIWDPQKRNTALGRKLPKSRN